MHAVYFNDFINIVQQVLHILHEHDLRCKPAKCEIGVKEIILLGHVVSKESK